MSSEKEWIARCLNLAQTERDSMKAVNIAFDRTSDLLNREERERLNACFKNFVTKDTQFYRQFDEITNRISSLRPHERTFKDKLNRLEKEITAMRVQSASQLEKNAGSLRKILDDIDSREKRSVELQTPAIRPKIMKDSFDSPISEYENFLYRFGGRTGGWDPQSHAEFMRQLDAHGADNLTNFLPKIDANAVNAHLEWYNEFIRLKTRMKQAVNEMKQRNAK